MNMNLVRKNATVDGIFGELLDHNGIHFCFTLEHPYLEGGLFIPKLTAGVYECRDDSGPLENGMHSLEDGVPFKAFEVIAVPEFQGESVSGILLHIGNYAKDSKGCVLLGSGLGLTLERKQMLMASKQAFDRFMSVQKECDSFTLTVS